MAIAASNLTNGVQNSASTSVTTASVAPTSNALVLVSVASQVASAAAPTISGGGIPTWVLVGTQLDTSASRLVSMFRGLSASPTSGTIVISFGAVSQSNICWSVDQFTGADTSGTNGSGAIVQFVGGGAEGGSLTALLKSRLCRSMWKGLALPKK